MPPQPPPRTAPPRPIDAARTPCEDAHGHFNVRPVKRYYLMARCRRTDIAPTMIQWSSGKVRDKCQGPGISAVAAAIATVFHVAVSSSPAMVAAAEPLQMAVAVRLAVVAAASPSQSQRRQAKSAAPRPRSPLASEGCPALGRECPARKNCGTQNMTKCSNYCALIVLLACRHLSKKAIRSAMSACRHHAGKCCKCCCDVGSPRSRQTHILPTAVAARSHVLWWLSVSTMATGVPIACANYISIHGLLLL